MSARCENWPTGTENFSRLGRFAQRDARRKHPIARGRKTQPGRPAESPLPASPFLSRGVLEAIAGAAEPAGRG
jgi:hypothetical protein